MIKTDILLFSPEIQGCYSQEDAYEEFMENIKDAFRFLLKSMIPDKMSGKCRENVGNNTVHIDLT
jgi:hypothetical protein